MAAVLRNLRTLRSSALHLTAEKFSAPGRPPLQPLAGPVELAWRTWVRGLLLSSVVCAGHNKWSKVKHIKGPKDEARAKMFMKLAMLIKLAVKEGGPNPELNINLAQVLEQCRSNNMPKASVETAIKHAEKSKPASQHMFEARGPGGCLLLIQVLTDNISRTHQDIKRALNKNGGALSDGARHNFDKRGVVVVQGLNVSTERALELAIEAGAEDVQESSDDEEQPLLQYICDTTELQKVRASLESQGLKVNSAGLNFVPRVLLPLDRQQLDAASTLVEALNDCADVVQIWDNIHVDS
ncbi:translational activator of cytochrome c oxidase 1 [Synchiropus splendidus]|uniref:translational activator of cytochrome c oxidase 1 n=1 Tax=Synchiropus splendidus TaxID=270530 RepID=UPI00237DBD3F|nr:translational activator of cytochrome c oxidase 1 [Synchiropus splendidus]